MRVRAVRRGWFEDKLREPGQVFECPVEHFSDSIRKKNPPGWMEIVEASEAEAKAVEAKRDKEGVRAGAVRKPFPVGSAESLGVTKTSTPLGQEPTKEPEAMKESKPEKPAGKGGTGSKDVLGAGK